MAKKKELPKVVYKAHDSHAYLLIRETTDASQHSSTGRRTSFIGLIYDRVDAEKICEILNNEQP